MNGTGLAVRSSALPSAGEWETMLSIGDQLVKSGLLPNHITKAEAAVAIILKGRELGIQPMYAMSNINVIKGKPTASAELMLALIYRDHGDQAIDFVESSNERCTVAFKRRNAIQVRQFSFTINDASLASLFEKNDNWKKYPAAMLRARCISAVARMAFPDTIAGMYTPEELGADVEVDDDGQIIYVGHDDAPVPVQQEPQRDPFSVTRWLDWFKAGPTDGKMADSASYKKWCLDWDDRLGQTDASLSVVAWATGGKGWKALTQYQLKSLSLTLTSERFTQDDREQIQNAAKVYAEQTSAPAIDASQKAAAPEAELQEVPF